MKTYISKEDAVQVFKESGAWDFYDCDDEFTTHIHAALNLAIAKVIGEPVAYKNPKMLSFEGARKVYFNRTEEGKHLSDAALKEQLEGLATYEVSLISDDISGMFDKHGKEHKTIPLYAIKELPND